MIPSIIISLAAALLPPAEPAPAIGYIDTEERTLVGTVRLDIPDEIAPALMIYFQCLASSAGTTMEDERGAIAPIVAKGADCTEYRKASASRADILLRQGGQRSRKKRRALIERTLISMAEFFRPRSAEEFSRSVENAED